MLAGELHGLEPVGMMGDGFLEAILERKLTYKGFPWPPPSTGVYACHTGAGSGRTA